MQGAICRVALLEGRVSVGIAVGVLRSGEASALKTAPVFCESVISCDVCYLIEMD
jgi:hypothetical protein